MLIPTLELALCVRLRAHHTNSTKSNYNLQKSLGNKHDSKKSQIFLDGNCGQVGRVTEPISNPNVVDPVYTDI